jgi:hypothetical protein
MTPSVSQAVVAVRSTKLNTKNSSFGPVVLKVYFLHDSQNYERIFMYTSSALCSL